MSTATDVVAGKHGQASANRDYEVLSHAYTVAIRWGLIDVHPLKGRVQKYSIKRRERYVEDWELAEALKVASPMLRAYVTLKLITRLRRGDLLRLRPTDLRDDGLHVVTSKTRARLIIEWNPALREAADAAL